MTAGTRKLTLSIDSTEAAPEVSRAIITSAAAENDSPTFEEAAAGGQRDHALALTILQKHAAGSVWRQIFDNAGATVPVVVRPYGNTTPSPTQPHYSGNVTIAEPDGDFIGGEADASTTARWTVEVEWLFDAKPVEITA